MKHRRAICVAMALAIAAASGWWVLRFPYDPELPARYIPAHARLVCRLDRPDENWERLAASRPCAVLLGVSGVEPEAWMRARRGGVDFLVQTFFRERAMFALLDEPRTGRAMRWVATGWVGGRGQWVRWGMLDRSLEAAGFRAERTEWGRRLWRARIAPGVDIELTISDGCVIATGGAPPGYLRELVLRAERGRMVPWSDPHTREPGGVLRGVVRLADDAAWGGASGQQRFDMTLEADGSSRLRIVCPSGTGGEVARWLAERNLVDVGSSGADAVRSLLQGEADGALLIPFGLLLDGLLGHGGLRASGAMRNMLGTLAAPDVPSFAVLLNPRHSGRFIVKLPAFVLGVRVTNAVDVAGLTRQVTDLLNATERWALVPSQTPFGEGELVVIDRVTDSWISRLGAEDKPAVLRKGEWVLFSNSVGSLRALESMAAGDRVCRLAPLLAAGPDVNAVLAFDADPAFARMVELVDVVLLAAAVSGRDRAELRVHAPLARQVLGGLRAAGLTRIELATRGDALEVDMRLGCRPGDFGVESGGGLP